MRQGCQAAPRRACPGPAKTPPHALAEPHPCVCLLSRPRRVLVGAAAGLPPAAHHPKRARAWQQAAGPSRLPDPRWEGAPQTRIRDPHPGPVLHR